MIDPSPAPEAAGRARAARRIAAVLTLAVLLAVAPACVTRKMFIDSTPSGARVMLDDTVVGTTPYEAEFIGYGQYHLQVEAEGYEPWKGRIDLVQPWWQHLPFDVFTDLLWPGEIRDDHHFSFPLIARTPGGSTWDDAQAAYRRMRERLSNVDADEDE